MNFKLLFSVFLFAFLPLYAYSYRQEYVDTIEVNGIDYAVDYIEGMSGNLIARGATVVKCSENYPGEVVIPEEIHHYIDDHLHLPLDGKFKVISMRGNAFMNCEKITSIIIPKTLESINGIFCSGPNLETIVVDNDNPIFDSRDNSNCLIQTESNTLLAVCKNSIIPLSVTIIGSEVFEGRTDLTSFIFHDAMTSIGRSAFENCTGLTSLSFPAAIKDISSKAFAGCSGLTELYFYSKPAISGDSFDNCASNITLYVRDVDIEVFKNDESCVSFKDIKPIEKVTDFILTYYVDGIEYKTIQYKYDDEIIPLEEPVKEGYTFSGWKDLPTKMPGKDVKVEGIFTKNEVKENNIVYWVLDDQAAVIGNDNATGEVKIASSVTFKEKSVPVTDIVDFSFKNNVDITSVVIPESVRKIGDEAFSGCKNLSKLELGKSVNQIEPRAFAGIDKLEEVIVYAENVPDADRTAFENSYIEYAILRVPANTDGNYRNTMPWSGFKDILPLEEIAPVETDIVTIKDSGKTSFCSEYDLDFTDIEGIKAYTATGYDDMDKTIWLTRVMKVPAGTGIMIKGTPGEYKIPHATVRATYANYFKGNLGETIRVEETEGDKTNYYLSGDGTFKSVNGYANIGKGKAYLQLPTSVFAGTRSIEVNYGDEEGTTGIRSLTPALSKGEGAYYNLQGQRVDKPGKGLYILNGKKVIVR